MDSVLAVLNDDVLEGVKLAKSLYNALDQDFISAIMFFEINLEIKMCTPKFGQMVTRRIFYIGDKYT